jgi:hypothetical protein
MFQTVCESARALARRLMTIGTSDKSPGGAALPDTTRTDIQPLSASFRETQEATPTHKLASTQSIRDLVTHLHVKRFGKYTFSHRLLTVSSPIFSRLAKLAIDELENMF